MFFFSGLSIDKPVGEKEDPFWPDRTSLLCFKNLCVCVDCGGSGGTVGAKHAATILSSYI